MKLPLKLLKKVRCRLLDQKTGRPLAGVAVGLSIGTNGGNGSRLPVSMLRSDATGYLSFDLQPLIKEGIDTVPAIFISAPQIGLKDRNLLETLSSNSSGNPEISEAPLLNRALLRPNETSLERLKPLSIEFPIYVEAPPKDETDDCECRATNLTSIQAPDSCDYELSPYSFVTPPKINSGCGCCETLALSTLPTQEHGFFRVVVRHESHDNVRPDRPSPFALDAARGYAGGSIEHAVEITAQLTAPSPPAIKFAEVLEYRQRWYAIGHSLGEIKYSLPLAPGESTQLAVIEWSRQDTASRYDKLRGTEYLQHELKRDRSIDESIDTGLHESQGGWSWMGGQSTAAAYNAYAYGQYTGNAAWGGSVSNSWGDRTLNADSLHDLHDKVTQGTAYVRSLTSTVIVQASQAEQNAVQTRRVANHNHCHALTIQYYEVLRHFRLQTEFVRRGKAVLIPFSPFAFTRELAIRFRTLLERVLLDETLLSCFDALFRLEVGDDAYPKETAPEPPAASKYFEGTFNLSVGTADPSRPTGKLIEKNSMVAVSATGEGFKFSHGSLDSYGPAGSTADAGEGWPKADAKQFALLALIGGDKYEVGSGLTFKATNDGLLGFLFNDTDHTDNDGIAAVEVTVTRPEGTGTPQQPSEEEGKDSADIVPTKESDKVNEAFILKHLNGNQGYYNRMVWILMDPTERRLFLEAALGSNNPLLYALDDRPLAVSGNSVAFAYNGPVPNATEEEEDPEPLESIVTLPTRGLFAEAQMGHCNSCEKRDITRMQDWTTMTTEEPPAISGIEPGPQGQMPSLTPSQFPANVIQITQPPAAPDPTGLANALNVLKTPDIFRDMSGLDEVSALLGKLVDGSTKTMEEMVKGANQAKAKLDAAKAQGTTTGTMGGNGTSQEQTPAERYDNLQVAKEVANSADELGLSDQQAADLSQDILGGGGGGGGILDQFMKMVEGQVGNQLGITSSNLTPGVNENVTFAIQGVPSSAQVNWSGNGNPGVGAGSTFITRFPSSGPQTVRAEYATDAGMVSATRTVTVKELSGPQWEPRWPGSTATGDLNQPFRGNVERFIAALGGPRANVAIGATYRPRERAYLMHYAPLVANGSITPQNVPAEPGVDISWLHSDVNGNPDLAASQAAAQQLASSFNLAFPAAFPTRHSLGLAIDMTITWNGALAINDAGGNPKNITSTPRTGAGNRDLHAVGATYGVNKLLADPPHWSDTGG
jgi:hypothetical protein